jgi:flagellar protein FliS
MNHHAQRTYLNASVATASPAGLLVMLFDRLSLDLQRALAAIREGAHESAHQQLVHAQEIVLELHGSLKVDAWDGGPGLAALYTFLHAELVRANAHKDAAATEFCRDTVNQLRDTWREAALSTASATA